MPTITLDQWQQLFALIVPFVVALAVQHHWPSAVKRAVAVALAVVAAVVPEVLQHKVNSTNLVAEALVVIGVSQGLYLIFKGKLDGIAAATTVTSPPVPARPPGA